MVTPTPFEKILLKKGGGSARFAEKVMAMRTKRERKTKHVEEKNISVEEYVDKYEPQSASTITIKKEKLVNVVMIKDMKICKFGE